MVRQDVELEPAGGRSFAHSEGSSAHAMIGFSSLGEVRFRFGFQIAIIIEHCLDTIEAATGDFNAALGYFTFLLFNPGSEFVSEFGSDAVGDFEFQSAGGFFDQSGTLGPFLAHCSLFERGEWNAFSGCESVLSDLGGLVTIADSRPSLALGFWAAA